MAFHTTLHYLEELGHGVALLLVFVPLLIGALLVATIVKYRSSQMHYRDDDGHIHELTDVEGDGLERAISFIILRNRHLSRCCKGKKGLRPAGSCPRFP